MNDFLKKYGTVREYDDSFNSRFSNMLLEQLYVVEVFICGLPLELGNNVRLFKPKSLSDAYCLALLQEAIYNFMKKSSHPPLFSSMKLNESNEEEKDSNGLLVFDELCKNDAKCNKTELRVSEMDDNIRVEREVGTENIGTKACLEVTDNFANEKDEIEDKNKRMGLSSLVSGGEIIDGANGSGKQRVVGNGLEMVVDEFVNEDDERKGYGSLSFEKEMYVCLESQLAAELPETLYFSPIDNGANEQKSASSKALKESNNNNDLNIKLLVNEKATTREFFSGHSKRLEEETLKVADQKEQKESSVKGWEDEDKDLNVFANDSDVHDLYTKVLTCENEFFANKKLSSFDQLKFDIWKWPRRKKPCYTNCKWKSSRWKFDIWNWPNRKKKPTHQLVDLILLMNDKLCVSGLKMHTDKKCWNSIIKNETEMLSGEGNDHIEMWTLMFSLFT
ncbi:hypothetical protein Tco_1564121 [Tanacetum coccineum]